MTGKVQMVCSHCGSADVKADSYSEWHVEDQEWITVNTFDKGSYCEVCDGETRLDEIPLEQWTGNMCVREKTPGDNFMVAATRVGPAHQAMFRALAYDKVGNPLFSGTEEHHTPEQAKNQARRWLIEGGYL